MFKKICALILLVCMVLSVVPTYAAIPISTEGILDDLDYIDDVRKYDMNLFEKQEVVDPEAQASGSKAVAAVVALGIMERNSEGKFLPDEKVLLKDFASIVLKLLSGSDTVTSEWYLNYDPSEFTTQSIAAKYIIDALGYGLHMKKYNTAYPEMSVATQLNLFRGLTQVPEAYITRLELAQIIYNALSVNLFKQTTYGPVAEYEVDEGSTLLSEKFNAIEISGTLTGVPGVNLYSNIALENERIAIDETEYILNSNEEYSDLLGKRVLAFARKSDNSDMYEVIGLMQHEQDESVEIPLDKVQSANNSGIVYEADGKRKTVSVNKVDTVLYNGSSMKNFTFTDELLDYEGSILIGKSNKNGAYDIAVIYVMESLPVSRVTSIDKKAYFKYGMKYDGLEYIDLNDEDNDKTVVVVKNGAPAEVSDIKANDVISVARSTEGNYVRVLVSDKKVTGTITEITSDGAVVLESGDTFFISKTYQDAYDEAIAGGKATQLSEIKLGVSGSFNISANGRIADCTIGGAPEYALLKQIGEVGGSLEKKALIRVFTTREEWVNYELSDKIMLDGMYTTKENAYETIAQNRDIVIMQPIRYRLSEEGKITFLDTMIDAAEERTDPQRLVLSHVYEGEQIDWTLGFNLRPTNYSIPRSSPMFYLPTDRTDEKKFKVIYSNELVSQDTPKMNLYSASRFYTIPVVVYEGAVYQGSYHGGWVFAINSLFHSTNENGEDICIAKGMMRQAIGNGRFWEEAELVIAPEALEMAPTLSRGDVLLYVKNADGVVDKIRILIEDATLPETDLYNFPGQDPESATGVVTDIDLSEKLILIEVNTGTAENPNIFERVYQAGGICIYDSALKKYYPANLQDINIGDKVLVSGLLRQMDTVVFR